MGELDLGHIDVEHCHDKHRLSHLRVLGNLNRSRRRSEPINREERRVLRLRGCYQLHHRRHRGSHHCSEPIGGDGWRFS
jgi:hypothetical protein